MLLLLLLFIMLKMKMLLLLLLLLLLMLIQLTTIDRLIVLLNLLAKNVVFNLFNTKTYNKGQLSLPSLGYGLGK